MMMEPSFLFSVKIYHKRNPSHDATQEPSSPASAVGTTGLSHPPRGPVSANAAAAFCNSSKLQQLKNLNYLT
jgi:hypothetical protein